MLRLETRDEYTNIWTRAWNIAGQSVRFTRWSEDFDQDTQRTSNALWVRMPKLGQQFWDYEVTMTIGKAIGTPIGVDKRTLDREFGYFANILVDVDMSKPIPTKVKINEDGGRQFEQILEMPGIVKWWDIPW